MNFPPLPRKLHAQNQLKYRWEIRVRGTVKMFSFWVYKIKVRDRCQVQKFHLIIWKGVYLQWIQISHWVEWFSEREFKPLSGVMYNKILAEFVSPLESSFGTKCIIQIRVKLENSSEWIKSTVPTRGTTCQVHGKRR